MGTTVAGVLAGETPYMPLLHKRNEIGVIISYALISLKTCIPNGTANLLFWHTHLIPYSMQVNSKGTVRLSRCAGLPEPLLYTCMISTSISIAGTNTVVILQRWLERFN